MHACTTDRQCTGSKENGETSRSYLEARLGFRAWLSPSQPEEKVGEFYYIKGLVMMVYLQHAVEFRGEHHIALGFELSAHESPLTVKLRTRTSVSLLRNDEWEKL